MASSKIKIAKDFKIPEKVGIYHRLICMTGENKGLSYFIMGNRIVMGRSEKADIQILDSKSSRNHVELVILSGKCMLSDLNSRNGVNINNAKVKQHYLADEDKIIIGSTAFKYNVIEVKDEFLPEVPDSNLKVSHLEKERDEKSKEFLEEELPEKNKKKSVYLIVLLLVAGYVFLEDEPKKIKSAKKITKGNKIIDTSYNGRKVASTKLGKKVENKIKSIIHRGRRELREKNFFRAIEQFNLALIADPRNAEASFLLKKSQQRLDDFIQEIARKAGHEIEQKRYRSSILQWCEIVRYLRKYPDDERYLAAKKQANFLADKLGYEKDEDENEYKCF